MVVSPGAFTAQYKKTETTEQRTSTLNFHRISFSMSLLSKEDLKLNYCNLVL